MADKQIIDKFFSDLSGGTTWSVGVSIARKNALPLDNTSVFKSLTELNTYTANGMAYMGQPVAVVNEDGSVDFYVLDADKKPQEVGKATVGDDKSIILDNGVLKLFGFDSAPDGAQLSKSGNKLVWALPDTTTAEGQNAAIAALQAIINGTPANPETGAEATDGLVKKVDDNAKAIKANTDAIAVLNGDATKEGSVAYQIAQIVEENGEGIDTLKEIAAWIADHPEDVAEMNEAIGANASAITALEGLVGSTSVAAQINAALKVDGLDKYALATSLTELAGRVFTAEGKITTLEGTSAELVTAKHTHENKAELDKIASDDVTKWNTTATDLSTLKNELETKPLHAHNNNLSVLDTITAEKVNAWDNAQGNAKTYTEGYAATKDQGDLADTAIQSLTVLGHTLDKNTKTSLTVPEAKTALGLGTAAYESADAFDTKGAAEAVKTALQGGSTNTIKEAYDLAASKITGAEVDTKIANAGHASAADLTAHISDTTIHVTTGDKQKWNAAVVKLESLTGESLGGGSGTTGGIASMIDTAIDAYDTKTVQPALTTVNTKLDSILGKGTTEADTGRLGAVEKLAAENKASLATANETIADHGTDIADAKAAIQQLQTDSATYAIKSTVDAALLTKADKEAYEATAATVGELKTTIDNFFAEDAVVEGAIDTLKEIATYIQGDESGATGLVSRIGALETKVDVTTNISTAINTAVSAEETRALAAEGALATRVKDIEDNKYNHATVEQVNTAKTGAETTAKNYTDAEIKELADGAVKTNTDNIATNTANIITLGTTKANDEDVYHKDVLYTKEEVDALLLNAEIKWSNF